MSETTQELNEAGVEAAAHAIFRTDGEIMGSLSTLLPGGVFPEWDSETVPEDTREAYRQQARDTVSAYLAAVEG